MSLLPSFALGAVAGARSQLPTALLAWTPPRAGDSRALRVSRTTAGRAATGVAALGELVADKLPNTPSRLKPPVFAARLASGALAGVAMATDRSAKGRVLAALAGAAGSGAWSWAAAKGRTTLPEKTGTPAVLWAGIEDAAAVALGAAVVRRR
jgi:uncharacterized membrane protein